MKRAIILGCGLLLSSALTIWADIPRNKVWLSGPQGLDQKVGKVWLEVLKTRDGDRLVVRPLTTPSLGLKRLEGADDLPLGLAQCDVTSRVTLWVKKAKGVKS